MQQPETILVIIENIGKLSRHQKEVIAVARRLAYKNVTLAILGSVNPSTINELQTCSIDTLWIIEHPLLEKYNADSYCHVLMQLIENCTPELIIMPHTYQVRDFAPKLAARLKQSIIADCVGYKLEKDQLVFKRRLFQGRVQADIFTENTYPVIVTLQAGCFDIDIEAKIKPLDIKTFKVQLPDDIIRTTAGPAFKETDNAIDLSKSEIIVAVGRGIKSAEHMPMIEKFAQLLGAEVAASRPVCDQNWLPPERQIGSSGQSVSPGIYFAIGISGAIQHILGMRSASTIVAINHDKDAPIFQIADIGIVGDLFEIIPALIKRLEDEK